MTHHLRQLDEATIVERTSTSYWRRWVAKHEADVGFEALLAETSTQALMAAAQRVVIGPFRNELKWRFWSRWVSSIYGATRRY